MTTAVATATAPSVPGVIEAGKPFDGASFLNDNLSIRDYYGAVNFAQVLSIGIGMPIAVDEFNASSLTYRNHTVSATVDTYAGLQSGRAMLSRPSAGPQWPSVTRHRPIHEHARYIHRG